LRTTSFTEKQIPKIAKLLGFENEPKLVTIRFAIFISLSIDEPLDMTEKIDFSGGKVYNLEVITGKGKPELSGDQGDYNDIIAVIVANADDVQLKNEKEFEKRLEYHCERGFQILASSLNENSDIYEWIKIEFNLTIYNT